MIDRWRKLLLCLGITPNYKGFHFLLTCLELLQNDPMALLQVTKSLYPVVAKHHNTSWRTVERDLRTVVNLSFQVQPHLSGHTGPALRLRTAYGLPVSSYSHGVLNLNLSAPAADLASHSRGFCYSNWSSSPRHPSKTSRYVVSKSPVYQGSATSCPGRPA